MKINANFDEKVVQHTDQMEWVPSPMAGVSRRMLDRIGEEVARATSIVRYAPGSSFSAHVHNGGEEFVVLSGVFQDEYGDFPAGFYVRNPIMSQHTPASAPGCEIFVKLWQFDPSEREHVRIDMNTLTPTPAPGRPGVSIALLYEDAREKVALESWDAGADLTLGHEGGVELLVLEGEFTTADESLHKHAWLRLPKGESLRVKSGERGAKLWVKTGHLRFVAPPKST